MARTEAARNADQRYKANKTRQVVIRFYPGDFELHDHLCAQGNKMGYIKRLISEDMQGGSKVAELEAELERERAMCEQFQADLMEAMKGNEVDSDNCKPCGGKYTAWKYSGGTYCGNGDFETLDEALAFADDGFCDYVRVQDSETLQVIKMHFTPTEDD